MLNYIRFFCSLIYLFCTLSVIGQTPIDSFKQVIQSEQHDTIKVSAMISLYKSYKRIDSKKSLMYAQMALDFTEEKQIKQFQVRAYSAVADIYIDIGSSEDSIKYMINNALQLIPKAGFTKSKGNYYRAAFYNLLGRFYQKNLQYKQSLIYYHKALDITDKNIAQAITTCFNNIAIVLGEYGKYEESLVYYKKAIEEAKKLENPELYMAYIYNNVSNIYGELNEQDTALIFLEKALVFGRKVGHVQLSAVVLFNIGEKHILKKEYEIATTYLNESYDISKKANYLIICQEYNIAARKRGYKTFKGC